MTARVLHVAAEPLDARVTVSIADRALAEATARALSSALRAATESYVPSAPRVVRLRTRKRFVRLGAEAVAGALVVVRVTETNARRLPSLVEAVRAAGPLGVQLQWDGKSPTRDRVERHVFAVLERARATPAGPPVVLSEDAEPALSLRILAEHRARSSGGGKDGCRG